MHQCAIAQVQVPIVGTNQGERFHVRHSNS
jgi:hypothetical protein